MATSFLPPDAWRSTGRIFTDRGHEIFYQDTGAAADVLVLLHGFPTASWDWHRVWPALKERFRLIAPDFLGFGYSAKPRHHDYAIADQAARVERLLDHLGITEARFLVHDYGDTVAQELLARAEDRRQRGDAGLQIRSICFLNGGLFPETHHARLIQRLMLTPLGPVLGRLYSERAFERSFRPLFGAGTQPTEEEIEAYWSLITHGGGQRIVHRLLRYIPERRANRERWVGAMQRAPMPLRLIDGTADPVSGRAMAECYRELIPGADVVLLEEIGHYPQMEAPAAVVREYLAFVELHGA